MSRLTVSNEDLPLWEGTCCSWRLSSALSAGAPRWAGGFTFTFHACRWSCRGELVPKAGQEALSAALVCQGLQDSQGKRWKGLSTRGAAGPVLVVG